MSFHPVTDPADRPAAVSSRSAAGPRAGSTAPVLVTLLAGTVVAAAALIVALGPRAVPGGNPGGNPGEQLSSQPAVTSSGTSATGAEAATGKTTPGTGRPAETTEDPGPKPGDQPAGKTVSLFDGKTLSGWKKTQFGGEGETVARDGQLVLETGIDLTGVTSTRKDLPRENYEIELDAMRVNGSDFFCGMTFPVGPDYCSLIVGGWGGGVVGISSLDDQDASENETTLYREFKNGKWYHIRVRITPERIAAWLDDEQIVDVERAGRKISTRSEVDLSQPLGLASWQSTAALKNIRLRLLPGKPAADPDSTPPVQREQESD